MPRLTTEMRQAATETAKQMVLQGATRAQVVQNITSRYGLKERQADQYLAKAREQMQLDVALSAPFAFSEQITARRMVRREAIKARDWRLVLDCLKDEAKLLDLYPATRHEHSWKQEIIGLVSSGHATIDQVASEFGDELAQELFGAVAA